MRLTTSKSKNSESFYITRGYVNDKGASTSCVVRKLGTLKELIVEHGPTRDDVLRWAQEQVDLETKKYNENREDKTIYIPMHPQKPLPYGKKVFYKGGYLFIQSVYYELQINKICRKLRDKYKFKYDINAILSDLIYARVLDPKSKLSTYKTAQGFLEQPTYELHDMYRALDVLGKECDFIQSEVYKNSNFCLNRNDRVLYYDCTNYYFEIEEEKGSRKYGKGKEHRPNPIIQMGLFMDADGIPLAFSLFPGNTNEQKSLNPLEKTVLEKFGLQKFIYCSDAGLGSEAIREFNHMGERAFIVTQSIKKLKSEEKEWALSPTGFRRVSDGRTVDLSTLPQDDCGLYYKEQPYTPKEIHQRLIITYSPKYARYQKAVRERQVDRAREMLENGKKKRNGKNPNDPARFIASTAVTREGEKAEIHLSLNEEKIADEAKYDGLYAVCTDLLDDDVSGILKVSEERWQIEECFRIMKTDFEARPVYLQDETRIKAHFLICFMALLHFRILEKKLGNKYTCEEILNKLRSMDFAELQEQGYMPLYERDGLTDALHEAFGYRTDNEFYTKSHMKTIQKLSKGKK